jgi:hypothetical protein
MDDGIFRSFDVFRCKLLARFEPHYDLAPVTRLAGIRAPTGAGEFEVPVALDKQRFLVRGDVYFWGSMMGACLIASVPIAIIYNFFVDRFVAGFTVGAVK